jgi:hypothetical protein
MDLGYGQWMARCGNEVCNLTNLAEAKRQALAMAVGGIGDYPVSDPIREYQELSALIEDRYADEFSVEEVRPASQPTPPRALQGDVDLEYYEDCFPKLPAFHDRRPKLPISEAA